MLLPHNPVTSRKPTSLSIDDLPSNIRGVAASFLLSYPQGQSSNRWELLPSSSALLSCASSLSFKPCYQSQSRCLLPAWRSRIARHFVQLNLLSVVYRADAKRSLHVITPSTPASHWPNSLRAATREAALILWLRANSWAT